MIGSITRPLLIVALSLIAVVAMAQQPGAGAPVASKAHLLSNAELEQLLAQPEKVLLIDVRRPDEISAIGGFPVYLSIQLSELANSTQWIPKDRTLVTVSNHAGRAGKAADLLAGKGFHVAGAVGAQTYEKAGGALAKIAIPPPRQGGGTSSAE